MKGSGNRRGEGEWKQTGWRGVETDRVKGSGYRRGEGEWRQWGEGEWRQMG